MSEQPDTAIEAFRVEPNARVGSPKKMMGLIESYRGNMEPLLPESVNWEMFKANMRNALIEMPKLIECTQISIVQAALTACELNLHVGKARGEAYILPFNNSYKVDGQWVKIMEATLIPGYKGLIAMLYRTGQIKLIDANVVYANDEFDYQLGMNIRLDHKPCIVGKDGCKERGEMLGTYCVVELVNGARFVEFMDIDDLNRVRKSAKSSDSPAYRDWLDQMRRKAPIRRISNRLPLQYAQLSNLLEVDNRAYELSDAEDRKQGAAKLDSLNQHLLEKSEEADYDVVEDGAQDESSLPEIENLLRGIYPDGIDNDVSLRIALINAIDSADPMKIDEAKTLTSLHHLHAVAGEIDIQRFIEFALSGKAKKPLATPDKIDKQVVAFKEAMKQG